MDDQFIYLKASMSLLPSRLDKALVLSHEFTFEHNGKYAGGIGLGWTLYNVDNQLITMNCSMPFPTSPYFIK